LWFQKKRELGQVISWGGTQNINGGGWSSVGLGGRGHRTEGVTVGERGEQANVGGVSGHQNPGVR